MLPGQQLTRLPDSLNEQLTLLFDYVRQYRCLLVFDNLESILEAGQAGQYPYIVEQSCLEIETGQIDLLARHALLKAQAKQYVRHSQNRLLLQPVARRLLTSFGRIKLEAMLRRLVYHRCARHDRSPRCARARRCARILENRDCLEEPLCLPVFPSR